MMSYIERLMNRYIFPIVLLIFVIGIFAIGISSDPTVIPSPMIGKSVPQFDLPRLDDSGRKISSTDFSGKIVLLNVWASWCQSCWQEHAFLMELANSQSIPIYGLNYRDNYASAISMLNELGDPYVTSAYDEDGRVGNAFGLYVAPETYLIDADGTIIYKHTSSMTREIWEREFLPRISDAKFESVSSPIDR